MNLADIISKAKSWLSVKPKFDSGQYWKERYQKGLNSGDGSYGELAAFKADVINRFVSEKKIRSVIEFGCGDGNQLSYSQYPKYLGYDVSDKAIELCQARFTSDPTKSFANIREYQGEKADLTLSLDVLYHLIEDDVYHMYLSRLFDASLKFVAIYAFDTENNNPNQAPHEYYRRFSGWVRYHRPHWVQIKHIPNPHAKNPDPLKRSFCEFFIYERT